MFLAVFSEPFWSVHVLEENVRVLVVLKPPSVLGIVLERLESRSGQGLQQQRSSSSRFGFRRSQPKLGLDEVVLKIGGPVPTGWWPRRSSTVASVFLIVILVGSPSDRPPPG